MSDFSGRLAEAMEAADMRQHELSKATNVPRHTLSKMLSRGSIPRDKQTRDAIAGALGVSATWLFYNRGPRNPDGPAPKSAAPASDQTAAAFYTPPIAKPKQQAAPAPTPVAKPPSFRAPAGQYLLEVNDARFQPIASPGDILHVATEGQPQAGDRVVVGMKDGNEHIMRFVGDAGHGHLHFTTPGGMPVLMELANIDYVHRVIGVVFK